ncbi:MAG: esterase-like activity of phytase family protein [Limisphaerales bacterium]
MTVLRNRSWTLLAVAATFAWAAWPSAGAAPKAGVWPRYTLRADKIVQLNLPDGQRFDASGLLLTPDGALLTESDRGAGVYRIQFGSDTNSADLVRLPNCFTAEQLAPFAAEKFGRYDCEGLAQDEQGRFYLCEEANRWILRFDPKTQTVERLNIDWAPVRRYFSTDRNASFEGIAIHGGRLYVANERKLGRLIVVDLATLKVTDHFVARPRQVWALDVHYSDLSWFDGALFVLMRESRVILKVDPAAHQVLAEYDYAEMENAPEVAYNIVFHYPTGTMEGLAVSRDCFWMVTDNNGLGRLRHPHDLRPTLFRCPRPDR